MKHNFRKTTLFVVALTMTLGMTFMTACGKNADTQKSQETEPSKTIESLPESEVTTEVKDEGDMKAPEINPNKNGLIALLQCPTTYEKLKVEVSEDYTEVKIYDGDKLLQTLSDPDDGFVAAGGEVPIYFMDANFDGYVDLFIGPGESRTYSTLLTWNPTEKEFVRVGTLGNPALQNFMLYPSGNSVFDGGSASWCSDFFSRSVWKEGKLQQVDELCVVNDPEQYGEYDVTAKFTLRDTEGNVLLSTNNMSDLPKPWAGVLKLYLGE